MENLVLVKLGGSLITDKNKPFSAKERTIRRLGREIKKAINKFEGKIVIGHGSGSFGHIVAARYRTQDGIINRESKKGLSLVADAAIQINRIMIKNFLAIGLPVFSFAPASFVVAKAQELERFFLAPIEQALFLNLIPVIYGDVILDSKSGCCIFSSERILGILARNLISKFNVLRVVHCGNTDGVYDEKGRSIPVITEQSFMKFRKAIKASRATDVTGGMLHKVEESLDLASTIGVENIIINGSSPGQLFSALLGRKTVGTVIRPPR
ncbi:MAG: isopentenyl phosphate kinase [Microgenomates group bacterium]